MSFWFIAIVVFLAVTLLVWSTTRGRFQREYGKAVWKNWTAQTYYWQSAIYLSTGITIVILVLLKWANLLSL